MIQDTLGINAKTLVIFKVLIVPGVPGFLGIPGVPGVPDCLINILYLLLDYYTNITKMYKHAEMEKNARIQLANFTNWSSYKRRKAFYLWQTNYV